MTKILFLRYFKKYTNLTVLFLLFSIFYCAVPAKAQWQQISGPEGYFFDPFLHKGAFFAPIYTSDYKIRRAYPGSETKIVQSIPLNLYWRFEEDADTLYLLYNSLDALSHATVLRSTDSGDTWTQVFYGPSNQGDHLPWIKNGVLFHRVGYDSNFYYLRKSTDWGVNWQTVLLLPLDEPTFDFKNDGTDLYFTTSKGIYRSTDAGNNWTQVLNYGLSVSAGSIFVADGKVFVYAGDELGGTLYSSTDGGQNWQSIPWADYGGNLQTLFKYKSSLYSLSNTIGNYRKWYRSDNGGVDWVQEFRFPTDAPVFPYNDHVLIAFPHPGTMVCSQNNGEDWLSLSEPLQNYGTGGFDMNAVDWWVSINNQRLMAGLSNIYHTDNDGKEWYFNKAEEFTMAFTTGDTVIASKYPYQFEHYSFTKDGGETWDTLNTPPATFNKELGKVGDYLVTRADGQLYKSKNGGASWDYFGGSNSIYFCADTFVMDYYLYPSRISLGGTVEPLYQGWPTGANPQHLQFYPANGKVYAYIADKFYQLNDTVWSLSQTGLTSTATLTAAPYCYAYNDSLSFLGLKDRLYMRHNNDSIWVQIYQGDAANYRVNKVLLHDGNIFIQVENYGCCNYIFRRSLQSLGEKCLSGKVSLDLNNNGVFDFGDTPIRNVNLGFSFSKNIATTGSDGIYQTCFHPIDTLRVNFLPPLASSVPPFRLVQGGETGQDFLIQFQPGQQDLLVSTQLQRPVQMGKAGRAFVSCTNQGEEIYNITLKLRLTGPESAETFSPMPDNISNDTFIWEIDTLMPLETFNVTAQFQIHPNSGEEINIWAGCWPIASDAFPLNNQAEDAAIPVVSDSLSNFKSVNLTNISEAEATSGKELTYIVYFHNDQPFTASFVKILDSLDVQLDPASFRILSTSHSVSYKWLEPQILEFKFENSNIPSSATDELSSHGFLKFAIKTKPQLPIGSVIQNRAKISFEYSKPLFTNTVLTEVKSPTLIQTTYITICAGETYAGSPVLSDTLIADTVHYALFDSVYVVDIDIIPLAINADTVNICEGEEYIFDGQLLSQPGFYMSDTLNAFSGCDSLSTLQLGLLSPYFTIADTMINIGDTLFGQPVFIDTVLTVHYLSQNGCDSLVELHVDILTTTNNITKEKRLSISPNPSSGKIYIRFSDGFVLGRLLFHSAAGRLIKTVDMQNYSTEIIDVSDWPDGVYFMSWENGETKLIRRFIVQN